MIGVGDSVFFRALAPLDRSRLFGERTLAALLACSCLFAPCRAEGTHLLSPELVVTGSLKMLEDPSAKATLEQVRAQDDRFVDVLTNTPNLSFSSSAYWFRFTIENRRDTTVELFLDIQHPTLDSVTLHLHRTGGNIEKIESGDSMPSRDRPMDAATLILPFRLAARETCVTYLRVHADAGALIVPMRLVEWGPLQDSMLARRTLHGGLLGLFLALFLYNLILYLSLPDRTHFYYVLYLPAALLTITSLDGFGSEVLYPNWTWPGNTGLPIFSGITFFLIVSFARAFLNTRLHRDLDRWLKFLLASSAFLACSPLFLPIRVAYEIDMVMVFVFPLVSAGVGAASWRRGHPEAQFFVFGQVASWLGLGAFGLVIYDVLPFDLFLFESISLGIAADALLLALALAHRIRLLQRAKLAAEHSLLANLEERKIELERVVAERTAELDAARRKAEWLAITDPLTGAVNRRGITDQAEREIKVALRYGRPLAVVLFDLDHFKKINDLYGHGEGDDVLRRVVSSARESVREIDLLGRIGGEEFLLVLPDTAEGPALMVAERVRERIAKEVSVGMPPHPVTASLGVASLNAGTADLQALMTAADAALYHAKERGRNRVEVFQRQAPPKASFPRPPTGSDPDLFAIGDPLPANS